MRPTVPVDLVVNCYERTYRRVLAEGFFDAIADQNRVEFAGRYAVINNVVDTADARAMAERLVASGEILSLIHI